MSNQLLISGGAKVRNLEGVIVGSSGVVSSLGINVPSGIPQLDGSGKILVSQLPNSVMQFLGTWNAATNTPTLANGTGNAGDVYLCEVAGTVNFGAGPIEFFVGDQVIYSGTEWERARGATGTVTSVALTESGDSLNITGSPITTSGTINIGFNGNSGQYINGAGNLTTFPSLTGFVPYTGATTNVDLGTYGLLADYFKLNVTPSGVPTTESTIAWNDTDGTMDIKLKGGNVTLQVGQEQVVRIVNKSGASLLEANYQVVRIRSVAEGGAQGQRLAVVLAQGDTAAHSKGVLGLVTETIADNQEGFITIIGQVHEIDTTGTLQGETWVDGDKLYLSATTAGKLTNIAPVAPNHSVVIGYVEYAHAVHGKIFVSVNEGLSLDELHNVYAPSPTANQSIFWNASTLRYENNTIAGILGYTPISLGSLSATSPLLYNNSTGVFSIQVANTSQGGYLSSTDWNTFNNKQAAIGYTPANDALVVHLAGAETITGIKTFSNEALFGNGITLTGGYITYTSGAYNLTLNTNILTANRNIFLKDGSGTLAFTSDIPSLSGYVQGSGTTNYLPKFTGASTIGNSLVYDAGSEVLVGTATRVTGLSGYTQLEVSGSEGGITINSNTTTADKYSRLMFTKSGATGNEGLIRYNVNNYHMSFWTNATEQMRLNASGNLSIGNTTDAGYKLDVNGTGRFSSSVTAIQGIFSGSAAERVRMTRTSIGSWDLAISGDNRFSIYDVASAVERISINSAGRVGIGTTSATFKLDVQDSTTAVVRVLDTTSNNSLILQAGTGAGMKITGYNYSTSTAVPLYISVDGADTIMQRSGGNVGIGTSSPTSPLNVIGAIRSSNSGNTISTRIESDGLYTAGSDMFIDGGTSNIRFYSTSERMRITSGGNVLIGTTTDNGYKLQVNGSVSVPNITISTSGEVVFNSSSLNMYTYGRTGLTNAGRIIFNNGTGANLFFGELASNIYGFTAGGYTSTPGLTMDMANYRVGIGTISPNAPLHVQMPSDGSAGVIFRYIGGSANPGLFISVNEATKHINLTGSGSSVGGQQLRLGAEGVANVLNITGSNVLIGTTTDAGYKLDVNGTGRFSGNVGFGSTFVSNQISGTETSLSISNGNVATLYLNNTNGGTGRNWALYSNNAGSIVFYQVVGAISALQLASSGAATFSNSVTASAFFESSDKRLKKELIDNPTSVNIQSIKPKLYIKNGKEELGYYAQDLQSILPSAVTEGKDGFLSLSYTQVHTAKIAQLERRIEELEKQLNLN